MFGFVKGISAQMFSDLFLQRFEISRGKIMTDAAQIDGAYQPVNIFDGSGFRRGDEYTVAGSQKEIQRIESCARSQIQHI